MAAQATVPCTPELRDAVVMLLDFSKAYDTLDRAFLYELLRRHGYPPHIVVLFGFSTPARVVDFWRGQEERLSREASAKDTPWL